MGFCRSGECGDQPCCVGHYVPWCAGWVGPTVQLCIYGFFSMMRPIEPFMTEFLTGSYKNLTTEQVNRQVYPVWTYSSLFLLVPVLLVTDFLRYKPVIVLQGLSYVAAFLLVLFGSGVHSAQLAFFSYSIAMAADVAYFSYIYSIIEPRYYQRVTSYVKGAILLGFASGALLAQLLVSLCGVPLYYLAFLTLVSVSIALIISFFLPMPKTRLLFQEPYSAVEVSNSSDRQEFYIWLKVVDAAKHVGRMFRRLALDCKDCYSSVALVFFCIWAATGKCGFYQVAAYVQLFWEHIQPPNSTAYNGAVEGISTLSGAAATVAVGHLSLEWSAWGELVLGVFTLLIAAAIFLMDLSDNIWISYTCFTVFKTLYLPLTAVCTFQIAKTLNRRRYALIFGVNSFVATVLQSVLTAVVIDTKSLKLTITSQFLIYGSYFAAISLLFTVRGVYTVLHMKRPAGGNPAERDTDLTEGSRP